MKILYLLLAISLLISCGNTENKSEENDSTLTASVVEVDTNIYVGAEQLDQYLPLLQDKRVALLVNHSSLVGQTHLVDTLISLGVDIKKIFAPEHGFRGNKERGQNFDDNIDDITGLPVFSLIGGKKRPTLEDLQDVDVMIYDIQDVGVRFYTYISSMFELMKSCAEFNKPLIVLDRPNPNGDYVDGPVLDTAKYRSFVGMLPIPVVYGMTAGELAKMINGEGWLNNNSTCDLTVIKVKNYTHDRHYSLPVKPSPNLPNDISIRLYPSLCFFEASKFSIGRGTDFPFQVLGFPEQRFGKFTFTPHDIANVQTNPVQEGNLCYGLDLRSEGLSHRFTLKYLVDFHKLCGNDITMITDERWFNLLIGNSVVLKLLNEGKSEDEIRQSWQAELNAFKQKRELYLIYE